MQMNIGKALKKIRKIAVFMISMVGGLGMHTVGATQPSDARLNAAAGYFRDICLAGSGDLTAALQAFDASDDFGNPRISKAGALTYGSFTGPDQINGSVKIGFDEIADHCSIIVKNGDDPMRTAQAIALLLADGDDGAVGSQPGFGDYPQGGFVIEEQSGAIFVAPLGTGASADIVHINYFPAN